MSERGEHAQQLFTDFMHKTDAQHLWRSCFPKHIKCLCIGSLRVGEFKMYIEQRHCQHRIGDVLLIVMCEVANLQFEALHARLSLHACDKSLFFTCCSAKLQAVCSSDCTQSFGSGVRSDSRPRSDQKILLTA